MNIPDEVRMKADQARMRVLALEGRQAKGQAESYKVVAEWARKEALAEAIEAVSNPAGHMLPMSALHALAEEDN